MITSFYILLNLIKINISNGMLPHLPQQCQSHWYCLHSRTWSLTVEFIGLRPDKKSIKCGTPTHHLSLIPRTPITSPQQQHITPVQAALPRSRPPIQPRHRSLSLSRQLIITRRQCRLRAPPITYHDPTGPLKNPIVFGLQMVITLIQRRLTLQTHQLRSTLHHRCLKLTKITCRSTCAQLITKNEDSHNKNLINNDDIFKK